MKMRCLLAVISAARLYRTWAIESKVQVSEEKGRQVHESLIKAVEGVDSSGDHEPLALYLSNLCFILDSIDVDELARLFL